MNFSIHPAATEEAEQAALWYEGRQPGLGGDFAARYRVALVAIESAPSHFSLLETVERESDIRRYRLDRFPYLVIYRYRDDEVLVVAVSHAARKPNYWKDRLD